MTPRERRLANDFELLTEAFARHPHVDVVPDPGPIAERFVLTLHVTGLRLDGATPVRTDDHVCELRLPPGYPRDQPEVRALTPVFHPNVADVYDIGGRWEPGAPLADLVAHLGDLLQFRSYALSSPLNPDAARWVEANRAQLPLGRVEILPPECGLTPG